MPTSQQKFITIPTEFYIDLLNELVNQQSEIIRLKTRDNDRLNLLKTIVKEVKESKASLTPDSILFAIIERASAPKRYGYLN